MLPALTKTEKTALENLAGTLNVNADSLRALIYFESRWNPQARNPISGARGLIQFTHTTARSLGFSSADEIVSKYPTREAQLLGPVKAYFSRLKPFTGTDQDLFMSVFYPKARTWPTFFAFPPEVRKVNPGITTPGDYIRKVYLASGITWIAPGLVALLILGGALLLLR